jgi:hypothetical protein
MARCLHPFSTESPKGEVFMAAKQLQFRAEARQRILRGASILADAVRVTLGPKSKCVLIEKKLKGTRLLACKLKEHR